MILSLFFLTSTTNLGEFLVKLKAKSFQIISYLWNLEYSSLEREIFGISVMEILAAVLAALTILHLIKFLLNSTLELLGMALRAVFSYLFSVFVLLCRSAWLRIKNTAVFLWNTESFRDFRFHITDTISHFFHSRRTRS